MNLNQRAFHRTALSVCIAALLSPTVIAAEENTDVTPEPFERIAVTGSNIFKGSANASSSAPITEIDKEAIEGIGAVSIGDVLNRVPSITSDINGSSSNISVGGGAGDVGVATTSLRNLGSARTLVLVNGRRYVSGVSANNGYGVDLNSIPTAIIERVDVLTGGQSAIYGSDAIAGVINIITKKDFEGFEINALASSADEGAERSNIDFTFGQNFDAGNAWVSGSFTKQEKLMSRDRDFAANELRFIDTTGDGIRNSLAVRNGPSHVDGAYLGYGDVKIFGNGDPFNTNQPTLDSNYNRVGTTDYDNQHAGRTIVTPYERFTIASGITFDVSDKEFIEFELNYAATSASTAIEEAPIDVNGNLFKTGAGGTNPIDVATSPYFVGSSAGAQLLAEMNANGGDTNLSNVTTNRRLWEFGERGISNNRDTFRVAGSYSYLFDNDMEWKTSAVYGVTSAQAVITGDTSLPNMREAVTIESDGNGGYQCANEYARIEGCLPVNPFSTADSLAGQAGIVGFSEDAIKYIKIDSSQMGRVEQTVLTSVVSGELDFSIGADNMGFAAGVEYRKESAEETPDSFRQLGFSRSPSVQPIKGSFDVVEAFGELYVPVADWLNVSLAGRVAEYSTVGTTFTYRLGLDAPVNNWIRLRGSQSSSVRAPNVSDLFASGSSSVAGTDTDICNGTSNTGTSNIDKNCASVSAIAARMAADPNGEFNLIASETNNTTLLQTGSEDLSEETADALTLGAVFTPLDNLSISLDYYSIKIEDGIARVSASTFVERCHDVDPGSFDETCGGNLVRDTAAGPILDLRSTLINADTINTSGFDFEVAYSPLDELSLMLNANFLSEWDQETAGGIEEFVGRPQFPEMRLAFNASYNITEDFNLFAQVTYRSETEAYLDNVPGDDSTANLSEDINTMDAVTYVDIRASYQINDAINVYLGSNNLLDQQPDILARGAAIGTNTEPRAYDVIGRQYFAGMKLTF
ncbi:TonB-dependent receptor [Shewanella eurypsychrophilus]|uniref:TonB-dependent receptor n=1 Tax=Shewanella eurypsychrophilus TaxID=2593656 RepID=A0ABX6V4A1_9GAMM|nr:MULTISPECIES: TonB-dependent receptor [Shewanella]QFU22104.1 TonB-dependent receptor plug domain-containing protein [Shewanella sp. YLB-09]QPG57392.1 TonB-dependent receptor [Shewanella eurypsychrophilus]